MYKMSFLYLYKPRNISCLIIISIDHIYLIFDCGNYVYIVDAAIVTHILLRHKTKSKINSRNNRFIFDFE